jgi:hypothetical protein
VIPSDDHVGPVGHLPQRAPRELCASGRLQITVDTSGPRHSWSDGQTPLERHLGRIVVALETDAETLRLRLELEERELLVAEERRKQEAVEAARRREEAQVQARMKAEAEARARYERGLQRDLRRDARAWALSQQVREFLHAVEGAVPVSDRGQGFRDWLEWAQRYADSLDPLNAPYKLSKELEPELSSSR